ncbi:MAG: phage Gp37/Gp68 family protein [Vulcanimicrobiaceae bacterium]
MSANSKIEWTDRTWNPTTGCTEVSPGCDHCYAKTFAERWRGIPGHAFENGFDITLRPERLRQPLTWRKPQRVFVNSMSDLFHRNVPDGFIVDVFNAMGMAEQHIFQVLTKRPERMRRIVPEACYFIGAEPYPNVWLGVSVENNDYRWRIDMLRETPAAVRFLSCEPLIGPLDLRGKLDGIHWVIVGGESGHGARPMHPEWLSNIRDACQDAGVAFFFKQNGEWLSKGVLGKYVPLTISSRRCYLWPSGEAASTDAALSEALAAHRDFSEVAVMDRVGKKNAGRELDGRTWDEFPVTHRSANA